MDSLSFPIIDFSKLNGDDRSVTMQMINDACENWGFFELMNHGISHELMEKFEKLAKEHYNKCTEHRFRQILAEKGLDEAVRFDNSKFHWESCLTLHRVPNSNINKIPKVPTIPEPDKDYKATKKELAVELEKLGEQLLELLDENLGQEKCYLKRVFCGSKGPTIGIKVSNNPLCTNPERTKRHRPHTDAGGLVLLFHDHQISGLQLLKDGQWVDVHPLKHSILVNLGDQLEVISNGKYKSVLHRVVPQIDGDRMSMASFYNPGNDALIFPVPSLIPKETESNSFVYPTYFFEDYMKVYADEKFQPEEKYIALD